MTMAWPQARFGEFLLPNSRPYTLGSEEDANLVGMRLYGQGPFHREFKPAMRIAKKTHFVIKAGDVIYNKLFAWKGTFGIVPTALDGMFVSDKFPTYKLDRSKVDEAFLRWYFRCPPLWKQAQAMSTGSAALSKLTLNPPKFPLLTIPLPPLSEQRRVVTRIEELAGQIQEACGLRQQVSAATEALSASLLMGILPRGIPTRPLKDIIEPTSTLSYGVLVPGPDVENGIPFVRIQDLALTNPATIPRKKIAKEVEAPYARTRLRGGEILVGVVGSIGKVGIAPPSWAGANIARAVCRIAPSDKVSRDYLALVLIAEPSQAYFREATRTLAQPTLNVGQLAETPIPLPSFAEQLRVVQELDLLQAQVGSLKHVQAETAAELDALLPAILDRAFKGELL